MRDDLYLGRVYLDENIGSSAVNPSIFASIKFREFPEIGYLRPFIFAIHNEKLQMNSKILTISIYLKILRPFNFANFSKFAHKNAKLNGREK